MLATLPTPQDPLDTGLGGPKTHLDAMEREIALGYVGNRIL
jgi:hypothetical protein